MEQRSTVPGSVTIWIPTLPGLNLEPRIPKIFRGFLLFLLLYIMGFVVFQNFEKKPLYTTTRTTKRWDPRPLDSQERSVTSWLKTWHSNSGLGRFPHFMNVPRVRVFPVFVWLVLYLVPDSVCTMFGIMIFPVFLTNMFHDFIRRSTD